jgi:hypothetical protein
VFAFANKFGRCARALARTFRASGSRRHESRAKGGHAHISQTSSGTSSPRARRVSRQRSVAAGFAARVTRADKARAFTIARGEVIEAFAALEIAGICGDAGEAHVATCRLLTERVYGMLTAMIR